MRKSRDAARLTDIVSLRKAIDLATTNGASLNGLACTPLAPCSSQTGTRAVDGTGWVNTDISKYVPVLPIDPKASEGSFTDANGKIVSAEYQFANDSSYFELRTRLESPTNTTLYSTDGGQSDDWYEVGTKLTLLN